MCARIVLQTNSLFVLLVLAISLSQTRCQGKSFLSYRVVHLSRLCALIAKMQKSINLNCLAFKTDRRNGTARIGCLVYKSLPVSLNSTLTGDAEEKTARRDALTKDVHLTHVYIDLQLKTLSYWLLYVFQTLTIL